MTTDSESEYLSKFEHICNLGRGGQGTVVEAKNKKDSKHYAVKRITISKSEHSPEQALREVQALATFQHPNIVKYYDAWIEYSLDELQETHDEFLDEETSYSSTVSNTSQKRIQRCQKNNSYSSIVWNIIGKLMQTSQENNLYSSTVWNMIGKLIKTSLKNNLYSSTVWNIIGKLFRKTIQNNDSYSIDSISQSRTDNMQMKIFLYIQMELCQRHSLKEWLVHTAKTRDTQHSLKIFYQIVNAVQYIHNQDLIHRDLKPANIFFAPDDKIKVGDFGLISAIQADCNEYDTTSSISEVKKIKAKLNTAGVGTALYMAPEQKENSQSYNNKVDVYSLGIIFFELLEPMTTDMERSRKIGSLKNLTFPPDFEQRYPDECKLLKIMLHENPKRRPTASGIKRRPPLCNLRYGTDFEESTQISSSPRQTLEDRNKNSLCPPSALSTDPSDDHTESGITFFFVLFSSLLLLIICINFGKKRTDL